MVVDFPAMGRKILFITTDQQRYDSLGCNGGTIARTPVVDALAADGIVYRRAYNQNTVCMPARSTILTGQYARTHGVIANGVQAQLADQFRREVIRVALRHVSLEPAWQRRGSGGWGIGDWH